MNHGYNIRKSKYEALSKEELNRLVKEDLAGESTDPELDPEQIKQKRIDEVLHPESDGSMFEPSEDSDLIYPSDNEYEERKKKSKRFVKSMPPAKYIDSSSDNETEKNSTNNKRKKKFQKQDKIKFSKSMTDNVQYKSYQAERYYYEETQNQDNRQLSADTRTPSCVTPHSSTQLPRSAESKTNTDYYNVGSTGTAAGATSLAT